MGQNGEDSGYKTGVIIVKSWTLQDRMDRLRSEMNQIVLGKENEINLILTALAAQGHVLLEDVPGVGKTTLVRAIAALAGCRFRRIQCTPDLMPSDITGSAIFNQKTTEFEFRPGPVFAQILLADELNRTSSRTQSALLEAMEEGAVTVDGRTYRLRPPFWVLATQNPQSFTGTDPLPEAQLDRFMMKIKMGYPDEQEEIHLLQAAYDQLHREGKWAPTQTNHLLLPEDILQLQQDTAKVVVDIALKQYIVTLVAATRQHADVALGASPRASLSLMRAAQGAAFWQNRSFVTPDDVKRLAVPVLAHRLTLGGERYQGDQDAGDIIKSILYDVAVPEHRCAAGQ